MDGGSQIRSQNLGSQNLHKKISTHLLTLLIIGAILQLEQRKGDQSEEILRKEVSF